MPVGKVHFWYLLKSNRSIDNTWQFHLYISNKRNIFKQAAVWDQGAQLLGKGIHAAAFQFSTFLRPERWMEKLSGKLEQQTWATAAGGLWEFWTTLLEPSALVCVSSQGRDRLT